MAAPELKRIFVGAQANLSCREHASADVIAEVRIPRVRVADSKTPPAPGSPATGWTYYLTLKCTECGHRWRGSLNYEPDEPLPKRFLAVQGKPAAQG